MRVCACENTHGHVPDLRRPVDGSCDDLVRIGREEEVVDVDLLGAHQALRVPATRDDGAWPLLHSDHLTALRVAVVLVFCRLCPPNYLVMFQNSWWSDFYSPSLHVLHLEAALLHCRIRFALLER